MSIGLFKTKLVKFTENSLEPEVINLFVRACDEIKGEGSGLIPLAIFDGEEF